MVNRNEDETRPLLNNDEEAPQTFLEKAQKWVSDVATRISSWRIAFTAGSLFIFLVVSLTLGILYAKHHHNDKNPLVPPTEWTDIRLPEFIVPNHYELDLDVSVDSLTFDGNVKIHLDVLSKTKYIIVHSVDLDIHEGTHLYDLNSHQVIPVKNAVVKPENQYTIYYFKNNIVPGKYIFHTGFNGTILDTLRGFYYSSYLNKETGKKHRLATTQFESSDARRAFPCLDEPVKKSTFQINVTAHNYYHALSNMPAVAIEQAEKKDHLKYVFDTTKRMSTYLVAYIVSDFEKIEDQTSRGINVTVWTQPNQTDLGLFGVKVGADVLDFYEKTYGINYPLKNMDMIAIPDFAAGAMENWGLVTYRDTALLYDPEHSSNSNKQRVAEVIAHELAHQWFGNLVTMEWWNDLWLNEGFAEYMEYLAVNDIFPEWAIISQFINADLLRALEADASKFTHPIAAPVHNPSEIQEIFDDISYGKGSSILRMLHNWIDDTEGKDTFFSRIHNYLKSHAYSNAKTNELWNALSSEKVDVAPVMNSWISQSGFPVLVVSEESTPSKLIVKQERMFIANLVKFDDDEKLPEDNQTWHIPLSYGVFTEKNGKLIADKLDSIIVSDKETEIETKSTSKNGIHILNVRRNGVYRVQYPKSYYERFANLLLNDITSIPAVDRAGIIDDAFQMLFSGRENDVTIVLRFVLALKNETDPLVWMTILRHFNTMEDHLLFEASFGLWSKLEKEVIEKVVQSVGWKENKENIAKYGKSTKSDNNIHLRSLLRSSILSKAVKLGIPSVVKEGLQYFYTYKSGQHVGLTGDVEDVVLVTGVLHGDESDYDWVYNKFLNETFQQNQQRLLYALASANVPYLQYRTLDLALSGNVRKQDLLRLIFQVSLYSNTGHIYAWAFIRDNWERLLDVDRASGDWTRINQMVGIIVSHFSQKALVDDADRIFLKKEDTSVYVPPRMEVAVKKGLESARQRVEWTETYSDDVEQWLRTNV